MQLPYTVVKNKVQTDVRVVGFNAGVYTQLRQVDYHTRAAKVMEYTGISEIQRDIFFGLINI